MGNTQEIETLINEEALLLGMYLGGERKGWIPRIGMVSSMHERAPSIGKLKAEPKELIRIAE